MSKELAKVSEQEMRFIECLLENGGKPQDAAIEAGYSHKHYGYVLKKNLAKAIAEAAQEFMALHSVKAAYHIIGTLDEAVPNPIRLQAAKDILDRAGVVKPGAEEENRPIIKQNIFILPEKRQIEAITAEFTEVER